MTRALDWIRDPEVRFKGALVGLAVSVPAWPVTSLTVFRTEPQGVLGLSWFNLILTFLILVATTDVRREQEGE